ncbi:unnamed protein product [Paramecium octaurelia]|uniref:Transmembrane protein n=1 Tax=Paramecium octaurelia TaxID=43137 RepID=A0A8S1XPM3_PAROT|nr:unnamed protein product [Paramecium octaurelia]
MHRYIILQSQCINFNKRSLSKYYYQRNSFFGYFCKGFATDQMRIQKICIQNYKDTKFTEVRILLNSMIFPNQVFLNNVSIYIQFSKLKNQQYKLANSNCYSHLKTAYTIPYFIQRVKLGCMVVKIKNDTAFNNFQILFLICSGLLSSIIMNLLSEY